MTTIDDETDDNHCDDDDNDGYERPPSQFVNSVCELLSTPILT